MSRYTFTTPSGRRATSREAADRARLLAARETCPACEKATDDAMRRGDWRLGACQCSEHRS